MEEALNLNGLTELERLMMTCEQAPGYSVLDHGRDVWRILEQILQGPSLSSDIKWPEWINPYWEDILSNVHPTDVLRLYTTYHDAGKPF